MSKNNKKFKNKNKIEMNNLKAAEAAIKSNVEATVVQEPIMPVSPIPVAPINDEKIHFSSEAQPIQPQVDEPNYYVDQIYGERRSYDFKKSKISLSLRFPVISEEGEFIPGISRVLKKFEKEFTTAVVDVQKVTSTKRGSIFYAGGFLLLYVEKTAEGMEVKDSVAVSPDSELFGRPLEKFLERSGTMSIPAAVSVIYSLMYEYHNTVQKLYFRSISQSNLAVVSMHCRALENTLNDLAHVANAKVFLDYGINQKVEITLHDKTIYNFFEKEEDKYGVKIKYKNTKGDWDVIDKVFENDEAYLNMLAIIVQGRTFQATEFDNNLISSIYLLSTRDIYGEIHNPVENNWFSLEDGGSIVHHTTSPISQKVVYTFADLPELFRKEFEKSNAPKVDTEPTNEIPSKEEVFANNLLQNFLVDVEVPVAY